MCCTSEKNRARHSSENLRVGSAAGTREIPKLVSNPIKASATKITPDHTCLPRNVCARSPAAQRRNNRRKQRPEFDDPVAPAQSRFRQQFRQRSIFGRPKNRSLRARQKQRRPRPPHAAHTPAPTSPAPSPPRRPAVVATVTRTFAERSARNPPGMENNRKGTEKAAARSAQTTNPAAPSTQQSPAPQS